MASLEWPDWGAVFVPDVSLAESFLRGTLIYFGILVIFRVVLKRQAGGVGLPDIMVAVLVSECVSNAINAQANSVANGLVAVLALVFWSYAVDWAAYRSPWVRRRLEPEPLPLVRDGVTLRENMRAEQVTDEELIEQLRLNGVDDVSKVKVAFIESCGAVSVIEKEGDDAKPAERPEPPETETASGPPDFERAMNQFLAAARELRAVVDFHEARAADHRRAAKEARDTLARHGMHGRKWLDETDPPATSDRLAKIPR